MLVMAVVGDKLLLDVIIKAAVENIRSQSTNNVDFALKTIYIVHGILAETDLHPKDKSLQKKVESLKGEIKKELEKITANHELFDPYVKAASLLIAVRQVLDELSQQLGEALRKYTQMQFTCDAN